MCASVNKVKQEKKSVISQVCSCYGMYLDEEFCSGGLFLIPHVSWDC